MLESSQILSMEVSFQKTLQSPITKQVEIGKVLEVIKGSHYETQTATLRKYISDGENEKYKIEKRRLSCVTFSATFTDRRQLQNLKTYNNIITLDIDNLTNEQVKRVKFALQQDPFIIAIWESPSGHGLKGLVQVLSRSKTKKTIKAFHTQAFISLTDYFQEYYGIELDQNCKDITRTCFLSCDKSLFFREFYKAFLVRSNSVFKATRGVHGRKEPTNLRQLFIPKTEKDALCNPLNRNSPYNRYRIKSIIRYLNKNKLSITRNYDDWFKVACSIATSFTFDIGEKYFQSLSALDSKKYNELKTREFLQKIYQGGKNSHHFHTIEYLAKEKGYLKQKEERKS